MNTAFVAPAQTGALFAAPGDWVPACAATTVRGGAR